MSKKHYHAFLLSLLPCVSQPLTLKMITGERERQVSPSLFTSKLKADRVDRMHAYQEVK